MADSSVFASLFTNTPVGLSKIFDIYRLQQPTFLSLFKKAATPTFNRTHYWHEQTERPRKVNFTSATNVGVFTVASGGNAGWDVGDRVRINGDRAVLEITATASTSITTKFVAANGSTLTSSTIPTAAGVLVYDSHPMPENSTSGPKVFRQAGRQHNNTQIIRCDVVMSRSAIGTITTDGSNNPAVQQLNCMMEFNRQLNKAVLVGSRETYTTDSAAGSMGGLTFYDNQAGCISPVDASGAKLHIKHINDAALKIVEQGGNPSVILCDSSTARLFSAEFNDFLVTEQKDDTRGSYVKKIVCDSTGQELTLFVEPNLSTVGRSVWVIDPSNLYLVPFDGAEVSYGETTIPGTDGRRWTAIGEYTAEFQAAGNTICRIDNFADPASSLTENSYNKKVVVVQMPGGAPPNTIDTPIMTATKKDADEITLAWDNNSYAVTYQYRYATTEAGLAEATPVAAAYNASGVVVGSLTSATKYFFQVRAIGDGVSYATSAWSEVDSATTDA